MAKSKKPTPADVEPSPPPAGIQDQPLGPSHRGQGPAVPWSSAPQPPRLNIVHPPRPSPPPVRPEREMPDHVVPTIDVDVRTIPVMQAVNPAP